MNSKNSKTSDPDRLLINLADKMDLKRKDKYLSNLSIYYTLKNIKQLLFQTQHGIKNLHYLMDHVLCQIF